MVSGGRRGSGFSCVRRTSRKVASVLTGSGQFSKVAHWVLNVTPKQVIPLALDV